MPQRVSSCVLRHHVWRSRQVLAENVLEAGVTVMPCFFAEQQLSPSQACCVCLQALTPSADGAELIAGTRSMLSWRSVQAVNPRCRNGKMWRLLSSDLTATLQSASHTGEACGLLH